MPQIRLLLKKCCLFIAVGITLIQLYSCVITREAVSENVESAKKPKAGGRNGIHISADQIQREWAEISQNNTRRVYNFGIGSLFSWSSRQYTQDRNFGNPPAKLTPALVTRATGIRRSFNLCWRYVAVIAETCYGDDCPVIVGASFEVTKDTYPSLRQRENGYDLIPVKPELPLPHQADPNGFYFVWGSSKKLKLPACSRNNIPYELQSVINPKLYPVISQAYWGKFKNWE